MLTESFRDAIVEGTVKTAAGYLRFSNMIPERFNRVSLTKAPTWWNKFTAAHPIASLGAYATPILSTGMSLMDAANNLYRGNAGLASADMAMAGMSLLPGGTLINGAKATTGFAKGLKGLGGIAKAVKARPVAASLYNGSRALGTAAKGMAKGRVIPTSIAFPTYMGLSVPRLYNNAYDSVYFNQTPEPKEAMQVLSNAFTGK